MLHDNRSTADPRRHHHHRWPHGAGGPAGNGSLNAVPDESHLNQENDLRHRGVPQPHEGNSLCEPVDRVRRSLQDVPRVPEQEDPGANTGARVVRGAAQGHPEVVPAGGVRWAGRCARQHYRRLQEQTGGAPGVLPGG
uniref:(northern house mosquito) hypothetical protein n=1 Tax=Culex pipiens TaxID=7175 RepID=A0A8D8IZ24_CULPI